MSPAASGFPALYLLLLGPLLCGGGRILVVPTDGSHWTNMKAMLEELHSRGHQLTVLRSAKSVFIPGDSPAYTSVDYSPLDDDLDQDFYSDMIRDVMDCRKYPLFVQSLCQQDVVTYLMSDGHVINARLAAALLDDREFVKTLRDSKFDLVLADPAFSLGVILGGYLKLPMVFNVRWINAGEGHITIAPTPVSYVPVSGTELTDQMGLLQRTRNMLHYLHSAYEQRFIINPAYSGVFQRHFPPGTDLLSLQHSADIWLLRSDFVFEFPRPTMPNVVYIGGFQCKPAGRLSAELEIFMQSSGEYGVVVMSTGTLVSALPPETTKAIAAAFAMLPQKVVWQHVGEKPSTLGNNTMMVPTLPQSDLLGHPKTRALVSHGGTNSVYEAIYHGVPVLGLPLLFDQFDNLLRLKVRGAARVVEARSLTTEGFHDALWDVLNNPSYYSNIQYLSQLHRDRPMSPMDTAIYWIEYVMRHNGAPHLRARAFDLPWYSYFCLDVVAFLIFTAATTGSMLASAFGHFCGQQSGNKRKQE